MRWTKASKMDGFRYVHILVPCPPGWGTDEKRSVELGRLAVRCGIWPLFEFEEGNLRIQKIGGKATVREYLKGQKRFEGLTEADYKTIEDHINAKALQLESLAGETLPGKNQREK